LHSIDHISKSDRILANSEALYDQIGLRNENVRSVVPESSRQATSDEFQFERAKCQPADGGHPWSSKHQLTNKSSRCIDVLHLDASYVQDPRELEGPKAACIKKPSSTSPSQDTRPSQPTRRSNRKVNPPPSLPCNVVVHTGSSHAPTSKLKCQSDTRAAQVRATSVCKSHRAVPFPRQVDILARHCRARYLHCS